MPYSILRWLFSPFPVTHHEDRCFKSGLLKWIQVSLKVIKGHKNHLTCVWKDPIADENIPVGCLSDQRLKCGSHRNDGFFISMIWRFLCNLSKLATLRNVNAKCEFLQSVLKTHHPKLEVRELLNSVTRFLKTMATVCLISNLNPF